MKLLVRFLINLWSAGLCGTFLLPEALLMAQTNDPNFLWLEDVDGERALTWVHGQNQRTLAQLHAAPTYAPFKEEARTTLESKDRLLYGSIRGDFIYNFWQDAASIRGLWRRATWESYQAGRPQWDTLLDIDALGRAEGKSYVFQGAECLEPSYERCLIQLSEGGSDAAEWREFDIPSKSFLKDGFHLASSKSQLTWVDQNSLLFANALTEESQTNAGYPREIRLWHRGQSAGQATRLFQGEKSDVSVSAFVLHDDGKDYVFLAKNMTFYTSAIFLVQKTTMTKLPLPEDATFHGVFKGHVLFATRSPLGPFAAGSLLEIQLADLLTGQQTFTPLFQPTSRQALDGVHRTKDHVLVSVMDRVRHKIWRYGLSNHAGPAQWNSTLVSLPDTGTIHVAAVDDRSERALLSYEDFLTPSSLYAFSAASLELTLLQRLPARFKTDDLVIKQEFATSQDGTEIPYFIVHPRNMSFHGQNPTLLYGYGGFEVPMQPGYSELLGKLWLERGGIYVLANIRGGGEFGPAWHQAALKKNRQKAFDDFIAVSADLIARKITTPAHLGIKGGSNGGLLMGAVFTQRPDLYQAVVCQVPLLDMLRFHLLLAGASWTAEYGSPDDPTMGPVLRAYSPFHNLSRDQVYPEIFFVTSTRDDRVHPGHARKMAARLEDMKKPFLYFENTEGGHGASADLTQKAEILALEYSYLWSKLGAGHPDPQGSRPH